MYTVTFNIENGAVVKVQANRGDNILETASNAGIAVDAPCSGNGTCGKCRMRAISGEVDMTHNPRLSRTDYHDMWRLACQSRVMGDVTLWVPASASAFKNDIVTADLSTPEEFERYDIELSALFDLGIAKGCAENGCGIAIDIGTTTVTGALVSLYDGKVLSKASMGNGQIRYGADVINRIIQSAKPGGKEKLKSAILNETLVPLINGMCLSAGIENNAVNRVVIAGNTTMEHLMVGEDAQSIRLEPYVPAFLELRGKTASDLGIPVNPSAEVVLSPNVGSYVGGDITAGVLASRLWNDEGLTLFIDLGTNGELVLGNADYMLCCACSAGPAFEGGDISCGMRATTGAVEDVEIDKETLNPALSVIGGGKPTGLCGSGLIAIISELFRCNVISAKGKFQTENNPRVVYDDYGGATYILATAEESGTGRDIELNESDLDNFIRAKAAIFSAVKTMLDSLDIPVGGIEKIILAGGIGKGIDIKKAISIGMIPNIPEECYTYIGNSSLTGACAMLLSDDAEERVFELGRNMTYIELSTYPGYMDEFIASCFIPHTDSSLFPEVK